MLTQITNRDEIAEAQSHVSEQLREQAEPVQMTIGFKGSSETTEAHWLPRQGYWFVEQLRRLRHRTWFCFGRTDPNEWAGSHSITCEINVPFEGFHRQVAGAYARDATGAICLTHNGAIGGGQAGVGKHAFRDWYPGDFHRMRCPDDGGVDDVIVVAQVGARDLPDQISGFVRTVERFKELVASGRIHDTLREVRAFRPEFEGQRRGYRLMGEVEAQCRHGTIVNALRELLLDRGLTPSSDKARDLYLANGRNERVAVVEAKTDGNTTSIYAAIGQLLYHAAAANERPVLLFLCPPLKEGTVQALERLNVECMEYVWQRGRPRFRRFDELIRRLRDLGAR